MKVIVDISDQLVEDLLVTAFEGGSNYWYNIKWHNIKSGNVYDVLRQDDGTLIISDIEDDVKLGVVTRESLNAGLTRLSNNDKAAFARIISENYDAFDADLFLQYVVMGEIIYS